jgi:3-dehydroquinate synthase
MRFLNDSLISLQYVLEYECYGVKLVLLTDENVRKHCLPMLLKEVPALTNANIVEFPSGERSKTQFTVQIILNQLIDSHSDKNSVLISFGGGVVSDIGGFVSSIYYRGIRHIVVPTTILSMIDASVGGKNGINYGGYKNQIGTIKKPFYVCHYLPFLKTLDERNTINGVAEIIKIALVADKILWNKIKILSPLEVAKDEAIMDSCINLKAQIVNEDFYDMSKRQILNFGHTFGHAIEAYAMKIDFEILHGEAVAIGMYYETIISHNILNFVSPDFDDILRYIRTYFYRKEVEVANVLKLLNYMKHDKKNTFDNMNLTLLQNVGIPKTNVAISESELAKILLHLHQHVY